MTIQDSISRKLWRWQKRMEDVSIQVSGTESKVAVLKVIRDKYSNESTEISVSGYVNVMLSFPDDEIPTSQWSTDNSSENNTNTLHMYDLLPITLYITYENMKQYGITKDSIILYKIKNFDDTFQLLCLQITDSLSKGNASSGITWVEFHVAPVTDYGLLQDQEFIDIMNEVKKSNNW